MVTRFSFYGLIIKGKNIRSSVTQFSRRMNTKQDISIQTLASLRDPSLHGMIPPWPVGSGESLMFQKLWSLLLPCRGGSSDLMVWVLHHQLEPANTSNWIKIIITALSFLCFRAAIQ